MAKLTPAQRQLKLAQARAGEQLLKLKFISVFNEFNLRHPQEEYRFHPVRRWRFDYCYPELKLAFEIEGGTRTGGRHTRPMGYQKDCEKYNYAALLGYRVIRLTSTLMNNGHLHGILEQLQHELQE